MDLAFGVIPMRLPRLTCYSSVSVIDLAHRYLSCTVWCQSTLSSFSPINCDESALYEHITYSGEEEIRCVPKTRWQISRRPKLSGLDTVFQVRAHREG